MSKSPEKKIKIQSFNNLMDNNKFVLLLSLFIAFIVWVTVAMYASPEESFTVYNVPITVNTENSLVAQKGYKNFWQSDEKIDVTVTGPRYLITSITPDDILVSANLNTVDTAGVSELELRVKLKERIPDVTISAQSKTTVEIYFDTELEKEFDIQTDQALVAAKLAEGYLLNSAELTVTKVTLRGPETEMNKIVSVVATPELPEDLLFETVTIPVTLSLEGANAIDTVSANKYVELVDDTEYFIKADIDRVANLKPEVVFTGDVTGETTVKINSEVIVAKIATESGYDSETLPIMTVDYSELEPGYNKFTVKSTDIVLPDGVKIPEEPFTFEITISYSPTAN